MTVHSVGAMSNTTASSTQQTSKPNELGKMDFLNILVTQLRYQDPLNPMDDKEFISQLAQFTTLEQMTEQTKWSQMTYGLSLVGKKVLFHTAEGELLIGEVASLRMADGQPLLTVGDMEIGLEQVLEIANEVETTGR